MTDISLHLIAAVGLRGQIGYRGKLPWEGDPQFQSASKRDLSWFARLTSGCVLIMGKGTFDSLPPNFDPGDRQIVIYSRQLGAPGEFLADLFAQHGGGDYWVCGGEAIYRTFMPYIQFYHITQIPYDGPADRYMPPLVGVTTT